MGRAGNGVASRNFGKEWCTKDNHFFCNQKEFCFYYTILFVLFKLYLGGENVKEQTYFSHSNGYDDGVQRIAGIGIC